MVAYTTIINSIFAILIAVALYTVSSKADGAFLLNLLYYVIITPVITVVLTKVM